jgi:N-hydroxyarylamine O-acetyltransferase
MRAEDGTIPAHMRDDSIDTVIPGAGAMTGVERLPDDVARAYLDLLELEVAPGGVDAPALRRLQRAHVERVPYETLDIVLGRAPEIGPVASARRILGGRGGYCYHLNGAFSALLAWLDVDVSRHLAGVHGGRVEEPPGPDGNHLGLTARTPDGAEWLVDVGLGDGPAEPLALVEGEHAQQRYRYRLGPSPFGDGIWRFSHDPSGGFAGFDLATRVAAMNEFEEMHAFLSTRSSFATTVTVQRRAGERLEILRGCVYTERSADDDHAREVTNPADWWGLVLDHFRLSYGDLTSDERAALWRRVRDAHEAWKASQEH